MRIDSSDPLFLRINTKLARLDQEIALARQEVTAVPQDTPGRDRILARSIGFALHNFYNGVEQILEDIAKEVDGSRPVGDAAHQELLNQMLQPTKLRPAIIPDDAFPLFDDLRRFRHLFRHSYGIDLRFDDVMRKFDSVETDAWPRLLSTLAELQAHLDADVGGEPTFDDGNGGPSGPA